VPVAHRDDTPTSRSEVIPCRSSLRGLAATLIPVFLDHKISGTCRLGVDAYPPLTGRCRRDRRSDRIPSDLAPFQRDASWPTMLASILLACDAPIGLRATVRGGAEQSLERHLSMVSAIEAEYELVEIGIHMLPAEAAIAKQVQQAAKAARFAASTFLRSGAGSTGGAQARRRLPTGRRCGSAAGKS
jgi:hypothetical protein